MHRKTAADHAFVVVALLVVALLIDDCADPEEYFPVRWQSSTKFDVDRPTADQTPLSDHWAH